MGLIGESILTWYYKWVEYIMRLWSVFAGRCPGASSTRGKLPSVLIRVSMIGESKLYAISSMRRALKNWYDDYCRNDPPMASNRMIYVQFGGYYSSPLSCIRASPSLRSNSHSSYPAQLNSISMAFMTRIEYNLLWQPVLKIRLSLPL